MPPRPIDAAEVNRRFTFVPPDAEQRSVPMTGDELRDWRDIQEWTQEELALAIGVQRITVVRWERKGEGLLSAKARRQLAELQREASRTVPTG